MSRRPETYLYDVQRAARLIAEFTGGRRFEDYRADSMLHSAVERQFEIMGEALTQLKALDQSLADAIPCSRQAIGLRNVLIHGYVEVDDEIVWRTLVDGLPLLSAAVEARLTQGAHG